jgi:hypothetical protein
MKNKIKILIIADEVWNDNIHSNNVLSNWFNDFDVELAEIYCSPGIPKNNCCENYFQLTDSMMAKSFTGKKAGRKFQLSISEMQNDINTISAELMPTAFYRFMKSIASDFLYVVRDLIWLNGRYDKKTMKKFIDDFTPDIIFCPRLLTPKLLRLERTVGTMTDAPFVAFTADDEASLKQISYSPIYWIRRLLFRRAFKKHIILYKHYFMFSEEQASDYESEYGVPTSTLFKSGKFSTEPIQKKVNIPVKLVYAGRLYCNRWKTLASIGAALKEINSNGIKMTLDIYTQEEISKEQLAAISPNDYIRINRSVTTKELEKIYAKADVALHVESFDKKFRYATRVSFSTKIIDLLASSCAILAICWDKHAGYQYLKKHDAAFCISDTKEIKRLLLDIIEESDLIAKYAAKAWKCGSENHNNKLIKNNIQNIFEDIIIQSSTKIRT